MAYDFPNSPTPGQVYLGYTWDGEKWVVVGAGGGGIGSAACIVSDNPPGSPSNGTLWYESDSGNVYVWYNDGTSSQWVVVANAATNAVLYTAPQALTAAQKAQARSNILVPFRGWIGGLTLSTAGGSNSFTVSAGEAADSTNSDLLQLVAAMSKTTAAWAVGSGNGGLDTGAIAAGAWYHVHLIKRLDTGVVDVLVSLSPTAPTLPANYTLFRRIGSMSTLSSLWLRFWQNGDEFLWDSPIQSMNAGTIATASGTLVPLAIPSGIQINALASFYCNPNATVYYLISCPDTTDVLPVVAAFDFVSLAAGGFNAVMAQQYAMNVRSNTAGQIRIRASALCSNIAYVVTKGWIDTRGRFV